MLEAFPAFALFLYGLISLYHNFESLSKSNDGFCEISEDTLGTCVSLTNCNANSVATNSTECPSHQICCPVVSTRSSFETLDVPNVENSVLPIDCGVPLSMIEYRITRGIEAYLFEFPWQVGLKYLSEKQRPFLCGGTLISNRYVLTAAHCIKTSSPLVGLRLGEYNYDSNPDCVHDGELEICSPEYLEIPVDIKDAIIHENYSGKTMENDIALIRLPHPIEFNNHIAPICLPVGYYAQEEFSEGLTVIGWGNTEYHNVSQILLKVSVPYVKNSVCEEIFKTITNISYKQLCAGGTDGKDSCAGDSGGPIMFSVGSRETERWIQAGVVSFGPKKCGELGVPGVYTRLTNYIDWILNNMEL